MRFKFGKPEPSFDVEVLRENEDKNYHEDLPCFKLSADNVHVCITDKDGNTHVIKADESHKAKEFLKPHKIE